MTEVQFILFFLNDLQIGTAVGSWYFEEKKIFKNFQAVLRIRIQDPIPFRPLDPGSGMGKKSGSGSEMNNPDHFPRVWKQFLG